jgi:putative heme iron utilization protein
LEESVLVKGLNHSIPPRKLNYADYCLPFELLFRSIKGTKNLPSSTTDFVRAKLKDVALSSYNDFNKSPSAFSNLTKEESQCLKHLAKKDDLVIQKSDKGNSVVILNKNDYISKVKDLLSDSTKFKVVNIKSGKEIRHIINQEARFQKVLSKLFKDKKITQKEFDKLNPIGSRPGRLYGLSKVHKPLVEGLPKIRPILSAIGTAGYNLAKFLIPLLSDAANGPLSISNNFEFNKQVLEQDPNLIMGSLDVEALFTSIPLDETIDICVNNIFTNKDLVNNLSKIDVKNLLNLATKESLFIFNGVYYYQTDGVAMGSPLGPLLANSFMSHYEQIWLNECPAEFKPKFYRRYVDDIFILCEKAEHLELFKTYFNTKHINIKFTSEIEIEGKLPFLDMQIDRNGSVMTTSIYRKSTFTGVYSHFQSFLPSVYKMGLLSTLLFRYFSICSTYALFHLEVVKFKEIFLRNGYPPWFIDRCIKKFLEKIFTKKKIFQNVPKKEFLIVLPFLGSISSITEKRVRSLFQNMIPWGEIKIVYKTQCRISQLFRFKDAIPKDLMSHLIYYFKCTSCNAEYIGETERHAKVRWCEHLGLSCFTDKPIVGIQTAIRNHIIENKCNSTIDDFKIIGNAENHNLLLIKESLFVKHYKTFLNTKVKNVELSLF